MCGLIILSYKGPKESNHVSPLCLLSHLLILKGSALPEVTSPPPPQCTPSTCSRWPLSVSLISALTTLSCCLILSVNLGWYELGLSLKVCCGYDFKVVFKNFFLKKKRLNCSWGKLLVSWVSVERCGSNTELGMRPVFES